MPLSANPAARTSLIYITLGALIDIWTGVWYWYLKSQPEGSVHRSLDYICTGLFLTGTILIIIGFAVGRTGKEARHADAPPASPQDAKRAADAQASNANATAATNLAANAPSGTPVYMVPAGTVPPGMPAAAPGVGMPVAGMPANGPVVNPAAGVPHRKA